MLIKENIAQKRYGRLLVIGPARSSCSPNTRRTFWACLCDCGNISVVPKFSLDGGWSKSCGCEGCDFEHSRKHGWSNTRLYSVWKNMVKRTRKPNSSNYKNYGARGVDICEEWTDFTKFKDWALANEYDDTLTIERIDNNGHYEPGNCTFIPMELQPKNRRGVCFVTCFGRTQCVSDWAREVGMPIPTLQKRINNGYSPEKALTMPPQKPKGYGKYKGVLWNKTHKKWRPVVYVNRKTVSLGTFDDEEEAYRVRQEYLKNSVKD